MSGPEAHGWRERAQALRADISPPKTLRGGSVPRAALVQPRRIALSQVVVSEIRSCFRRCGRALFLDREQLSRSRLTASVDLRSIDTGSRERDAHVRSAESFDATKFPVAKLRSESIAEVGLVLGFALGHARQSGGAARVDHDQRVIARGVEKPIERSTRLTLRDRGARRAGASARRG